MVQSSWGELCDNFTKDSHAWDSELGTRQNSSSYLVSQSVIHFQTCGEELFRRNLTSPMKGFLCPLVQYKGWKLLPGPWDTRLEVKILPNFCDHACIPRFAKLLEDSNEEW